MLNNPFYTLCGLRLRQVNVLFCYPGQLANCWHIYGGYAKLLQKEKSRMMFCYIVFCLWHLLPDMRVHVSQPTPLYCANKSANYIAHNDVFHELTKHIEIDCHFVHQHIRFSIIVLKSISSNNQLADFFNKSHLIQEVHTSTFQSLAVVSHNIIP